MKIQDAIQSDKEFRRFCCLPPMMNLKIIDGFICWADTGEKAILPAKDFLKDDWITIEDEKK